MYLNARYCVKICWLYLNCNFLILFFSSCCLLSPLPSLAIAGEGIFSKWFESAPQLSLASLFGQIPTISLLICVLRSTVRSVTCWKRKRWGRVRVICFWVFACFSVLLDDFSHSVSVCFLMCTLSSSVSFFPSFLSLLSLSLTSCYPSFQSPFLNLSFAVYWNISLFLFIILESVSRTVRASGTIKAISNKNNSNKDLGLFNSVL